MKTADKLFFILVFLFIIISGAKDAASQVISKGSVIADFSIPDTVCVNQPVPITNLSQGATTYFWRFCSGNAVTNANGIDLGNLSNTLNAPWGITLVQDGVSFFAFVTNSGNGTITRVYWANGLKNNPVAVNLGNFSILTTDVFGIQVKNDNGNWIGYVTNGTSLVRIDFGTSLLNSSPVTTAVEVAPFIDNARGLVIEKDGNDWVGFTTNWPTKTITRFSWGSSLSSTPLVANLGNVGGLTDPMQPALIRDNTGWYLFVANTTSLSQLFFGNSLLNTPAGTNLGNLGTMTDDRGLCLFMECNNPYGLIVNHNLVNNVLLQLHFKGGLGGSKAITPLGNVGSLYEPSALTEAVIIGDTIYTIALNERTLSTLFFPPCNDTPIPSSTQFDPSPIVFSTTGTYTISLTVDPGLATEQRICKEIEIDTPDPFSFGKDTTICEGTDLLLTPGNGYKTYLWNTGATSPAIHVTQTGDYSVRVTSYHGCPAADTIHVDVVNILYSTVDTSICWGKSYLAGGKMQTTSGTYYDTLTTQYGCKKIVTTHLVVKPDFNVNIGQDTCLVRSSQRLLNAHVDGASDYTWQDGSHDSVYNVTMAGNYWVRVIVNKCSRSDTVHINKCPELIYFYFPSAFTPNGDGLNDVFRPTGNEIADFHMMIFDRWGQMLFETLSPLQGWDGTFKGKYSEPGVYTYVASYANTDNPGEVIKTNGNFTLVR